MTQVAFVENVPDFSNNSWGRFFEKLLSEFSNGVYEPEILKAKAIFFERLGRSHEMREDVYESVSRSFLEWYIFDYVLSTTEKTPAVTFLFLELGTSEERELLKKVLFHHWSLFRVESIEKHHVYLQDLLFTKERHLLYHPDEEVFQVWRVKKSQIVQARLFPADVEKSFFVTHVWLHPDSERAVLEEMTENLAPVWGLHREFLRQSFECLVRSLSLQSQMIAIQSHNWVYQEMRKRYASPQRST